MRCGAGRRSPGLGLAAGAAFLTVAVVLALVGVVGETARKADLDQAISMALAPWRRHRAVHDPGKILLDVALAVDLGGDCLSDVGMLRAEPAVLGRCPLTPRSADWSTP